MSTRIPAGSFCTGALRGATQIHGTTIAISFLQRAPVLVPRLHIVSRQVMARSRLRFAALGFASLWLGLAGCGGGGGTAPPTPTQTPPPPTSTAGADLSGAWAVEITLEGTGNILELYSEGLLDVDASGGSSHANWRGSDTVIFTTRRESHFSVTGLTITNNGSSANFAFTFPHYSIDCTFTADLSSTTNDSLNGVVSCPTSDMQGTFAAIRGIPLGDTMPGLVAVDAVDMSTCALGTDGMVFCWGKNLLGELGTGDARPRIVPAASNDVMAFKKISLSTGGAHACGLDINGNAYCWGGRDGGRMGDGLDGEPWTYSFAPIAVSGGLTFTDIATGGDHVCAVSEDGSAWCWGYNSRGQLGTGDFLERLVPTKISGNTLFKSITAHQVITCGIATDDSAWCWGDGFNGGLGNGTTAVTNVPVAVSGQLRFASLQLGVWSTCGVTTGGDGYCWGSNWDGELGAGLTSDFELEPVPVAGGLKWKNISPGITFTCGVATDGVGYCWGRNASGERGDGDFPASPRGVPGPVAGDLVFLSIDADWHSCGVTIDGDVYCWGPGFFGSIGNGRLDDVGVPTLVSGS
jgi:alpha-tubulin suppressor-like RCC1 family protein